MARTRFHHGDLTNALIDAAVELLEAGDASVLTLREVARRAGVTSGAPYHHFPTRADLFAAVATRGFMALGEAIEASQRRAGTPVQRFERRMLAYLSFARAHPAHYRVMFHPEIRGSGSHEAHAAISRAAFDQLVDGVRAVRPDLAELALRQLALTTWAAAHGLVTLSLDGYVEGLAGSSTKATLEECAAHLTTMLETASGPRARASSRSREGQPPG
jgi:AcrR family transcriptional regulator